MGKKQPELEFLEEDGGVSKKPLPLFVRNLIIALVMLVVTAILVVLWFVFRPDNSKNQHYTFEIETISELSTLECRYHNVAIHNKEGDWLGVGKQYVWFEYDVIVSVGVDASKIQIEQPTEDGVVKIYLPPAEIQSAVEDLSTIFKPVCELGPFTKLTTAEENEIINDGISKLKADAKTQYVIQEGYESAKDVIEQYVITAGKMVGQDYRVEWLAEPKS